LEREDVVEQCVCSYL